MAHEWHAYHRPTAPRTLIVSIVDEISPTMCLNSTLYTAKVTDETTAMATPAPCWPFAAPWDTSAASLDASETALVVAHDAVNKTILCHLLGLTPADIWAVKQGNGGVTVVDMPTDPGQPAVVTCLNLTSHLGGVLDRTAAGAL